MKINEVWKKGHPSKKQMVRMLESFFKGKADITVLPKNHQRGDIQVEIFVYLFIDIFGMKGFSDRYLNLVFEFNKLEKQGTLNSSEYIKYSKKIDKFFNRVYKRAVINFRKMLPYGWIAGSGFDITGSFDIDSNNKMKFYIKRDHSDAVTNKGTFYHVTSKSNLDNILKNGIELGSNTALSFDGYRDRVYLLGKYPEADFIARLMARSNIRGDFSTEIAILKVDVPKDIKIYSDPEYSKGYFVEEPILSTNIEVDYTGLIEDNPRFEDI